MDLCGEGRGCESTKFGSRPDKDNAAVEMQSVSARSKTVRPVRQVPLARTKTAHTSEVLAPAASMTRSG